MDEIAGHVQHVDDHVSHVDKGERDIQQLQKEEMQRTNTVRRFFEITLWIIQSIHIKVNVDMLKCKYQMHIYFIVIP